MGWFGSDKWECNNCGDTFRSNPSECSECGHTVFTQYREHEEETVTKRRQPVPEPEPQKAIWYCGKCKQKHTEEPLKCKVCGTEDFDKVEKGSSTNEENHQYTEPDDDADTISNVREATSSPVQSNSEDSVLGLYLWILLFILVTALVIYLL